MSQINASIHYDVYGFKTKDLEGIASDLGKALGVCFISRRDKHLGRYYQTGGQHEENFSLHFNHDEYHTEDWFEPGYKAFVSVLYVNRTPRADEVEGVIAREYGEQACLLRRNIYQDEHQDQDEHQNQEVQREVNPT